MNKAFYRLERKPISTSGSKSCTNGTLLSNHFYQNGMKGFDPSTQQHHNFTHKKNEVLASGTELPQYYEGTELQFLEEYSNFCYDSRNKKSTDFRSGYSYQLSIPKELTTEESIQVSKDYIKALKEKFNKDGFVNADNLYVGWTLQQDPKNPDNKHCVILISKNEYTAEKKFSNNVKYLEQMKVKDSPFKFEKLLKEERKLWEEVQNKFFKENDKDLFVDSSKDDEITFKQENEKIPGTKLKDPNAVEYNQMIKEIINIDVDIANLKAQLEELKAEDKDPLEENIEEQLKEVNAKIDILINEEILLDNPFENKEDVILNDPILKSELKDVLEEIKEIDNETEEELKEKYEKVKNQITEINKEDLANYIQAFKQDPETDKYYDPDKAYEDYLQYENDPIADKIYKGIIGKAETNFINNYVEKKTAEKIKQQKINKILPLSFAVGVNQNDTNTWKLLAKKTFDKVWKKLQEFYTEKRKIKKEIDRFSNSKITKKIDIIKRHLLKNQRLIFHFYKEKKTRDLIKEHKEEVLKRLNEETRKHFTEFTSDILKYKKQQENANLDQLRTKEERDKELLKQIDLKNELSKKLDKKLEFK